MPYEADTFTAAVDFFLPDEGAERAIVMSAFMPPEVVSVSVSPTHSFSKSVVERIQLIEGQGVEGDAHSGHTVKHRSRVDVDPSQPNLRQVHLIHADLFEMLRGRGFEIHPGQIGENILTSGIALLALPVGTRLRIGPTAVIAITGLRNPCLQLDLFQTGLMAALLDRKPDGERVRLAGVMGVVVRSGRVEKGMEISIELPDLPHRPLERV